MKKLLLLGLVISLCLYIAVPSYAASVGGTETQGRGKFAVGLDQEFMFNRDMKLDKANHTVPALDKAKIKIERTMAKVSYGLLDNLDLYLKLGTADFKEKIREDSGNTNIYAGENAFAYGFGIKTTYPLENDFLIGCDLQYLTHKNNWKPKGNFQGQGNKATIQEWQIAPYVGKKLGNFVPYAGVKYSDVRMKIRWAGADAGNWDKYKAKHNIGVFLGTDYKLKKNWKLNGEVRLIDETAMSLACTYRF